VKIEGASGSLAICASISSSVGVGIFDQSIFERSMSALERRTIAIPFSPVCETDTYDPASIAAIGVNAY
jgi:hypothetical protein